MKTKLFSISLLLFVAVGMYAYTGQRFGFSANGQYLYYCVVNDTLEPYTAAVTYGYYYKGYVHSCNYEYETIVIPEKVTDGRRTFNVKLIGEEAFADCSKLRSIIIPDGVTDIGSRAFENCTSLNSIMLPTTLRILSSGVFRNCTSLDSITIPNNVIGIMWEAFRNCTSLKSIILPDTLLYIDSYLFKDCSSLRTVTIPDSVRSIGYNAFENCTSLDSISIPGRVEYIGDRAFTGCSKLRCITIEEGVQEIDEEVFAKDDRDSAAMVNVTIPRSVRKIGKKAFYNCKLENIKINSEDCHIDENAFSNGMYSGAPRNTYVELHCPCHHINPNAFCDDYFFLFTSIELIVPCGMVADYKKSINASYVHGFNTPTITANIVQGKWDTFCGVSIDAAGECSPDTALIEAYTEYTDLDEECIFFSHWGDGNIDNPRTIVFTQDTTIVAHFDRLAYEVKIDRSSNLGKVSVSPERETYYCIEDTITLTATPNDGYVFKGWSDGNVDNPRTLVVTDNVILSPIYEKITALDDVVSDAKKPYKVIYQGQMYIIRDGVIYTATGTKL